MPPPTNYAFRITTPFATLPNTIAAIAKSSDVLVIYEHNDSKRIHVHGYVEGLTISTDTFKNWIKKELGVTEFPKTDWEFATKISKGSKKGQPVDRDAMFYFHKGKYPILFNKDMPEDEIEDKHVKSRWHYCRTPEEAARMAALAGEPVEPEERIVVKTKKLTQYQMSQLIQSQMLNEDGEYETRISKIVELTINTLHNNGALAHKRIVANIVQDIRASFDRTRYINEIVNMV